MRKQKMITNNWIDEENARATELVKTGNTTNSRAPLLIKNTKQPTPIRRIRSIYIQESHGLAFDKLVFEQKITKGKKAPELMEEAIELLIEKYSSKE
ncbi:MAG: hypothetical protein EB000_01190 [Alphaproteobacteria bacterium]|jgi:hypothetical protein|nr:hypothetical protein [Alphaproteobacteria bacterium]